MKTHVTVIPSDGIISVDGEVLFLDSIKSETFHALQWHDGAGHVEPGDGLPNEELTTDDYAGRVAPYVALWEEENARLEEEKARLEEEANRPPTEEELFAQLRAVRDAKLTATDKYLLPDYPISADSLTAIKTYRQALRDLPDQDGAPWDGGGDATPWPEVPEV